MSRPEGLLELQGNGRLGETWSVRSGREGRLTAKRLRAEDRSLDELIASLEALTRVRHPALVPVIEVTRQGGDVWLRSEHAAGFPLRRLLLIASLTPAQVAFISRGILDGLAALAAAGTAHGDLHANNVHVGPDGGVRLSDGGLQPLVAHGGADGWQAADADAVADLLNAMAGDARRRGGAWRTPAARDLLGTADAIRRAAGVGSADLGATQTALSGLFEKTAALLPEGASERSAGELAALVRALYPSPSAQLAPIRVHPPKTRPRSALQIPQLTRRARRWLIAAALVLAICLCSLVAWRLSKAHHPPVVRHFAVATLAAAPAYPGFLPVAAADGPGS